MRSTRSSISLAILGLALALAPGGAALAQGEATWDERTIQKEVSPVDLAKDESLRNQPCKFTAKVAIVTGNNVIIRGPDRQPFDRLPLRFDAPLVAARRLDELHDRDNIRVFGYVPKTGPLEFVVKNFVKRGDDAKLFREQAADLEKAGDAAGLFKLGDDVLDEAKASRQPALEAVGREAYRAAIAVKERNIKPDDPGEWASLAADTFTRLGDRQGALDRLVKAIEPGKPPAPAVKDVLAKLDAVFYRGRWVLREEMKREEGFVQRKDGKWVLRERAEFEDEIEKHRASRANPRNNLDDHYQFLASKGTVETGMKRAEVALAIGFPDDVDRIRVNGKVYDSWTYDGRGRFFFENGILFRKADAPR